MQQTYAGQRLGLPPAGPGSVAGPGIRLLALLVDFLMSWLVATLITRSAYTGVWSTVVFLVEYAALTAMLGQSAGMVVCRLRVVRLDRGRLGLRWVLVRTFLLALLVPALLTDRDMRGMHDRAANAVVVRL